MSAEQYENEASELLTANSDYDATIDRAIQIAQVQALLAISQRLGVIDQKLDQMIGIKMEYGV